MTKPGEIGTIMLDEAKETLLIIDQTLLPGEKKILRLQTKEEIYTAITKLQVRGAPAIGIAAAMGLYLAIKDSQAINFAQFYAEIMSAKEYLIKARPTAVNLCWALNRMEEIVPANKEKNIDKIKKLLLAEVEKMIAEDTEVCRKIGEHGLTLLHDNDGILTHCNAGALATTAYGTALAPIYLAAEKGWQLKVYADETRPLLQGARLTAYELKEANIDITLLCDNMAASVMAKGRIQAVITGCDRVAANGDTANKIGTLQVAILARYYHIPFYIAAPTSSIDPLCPGGKNIIIEERAAAEVSHYWYAKPMAPAGVKIFNPAFDVTPAHLITAFITENGIIYPPYNF